MAPTPARLLACLALACGLLTACSGAPSGRTEVAGSSATAPDRPAPDPTTSPSATDAPTTPPTTADDHGSSIPRTPDLSGNVIDCSAVEEPCDRGDDPRLDELWEACADGDGRACDRLYYDAGFDTRYEQFGNTCGDRDVLVPCPRELS